MATHSSVLAWRIPGTGEPGGLPSLGSHRVGHDWSDLAAAAAVYVCQCYSPNLSHSPLPCLQTQFLKVIYWGGIHSIVFLIFKPPNWENSRKDDLKLSPAAKLLPSLPNMCPPGEILPPHLVSVNDLTCAVNVLIYTVWMVCSLCGYYRVVKL